MRIAELTMENFRNVEMARIAFGGSFHFLLGANGQGKTNCLEAIALVTALRSFRTHEVKPLVRSGSRLARVRMVVQRERQPGSDDTIIMTFGGKKKSVETNGNLESRFSEFVGRFPTVVFSSDDIQLLRGSPQVRRRFLDLTLASVDKEYFSALRGYHRALQERNRLLRGGARSAPSLNAYDQVLAPLAVLIHERRLAGLSRLAPWIEGAYHTLTQGNERVSVELDTDPLPSVADYIGMLERCRQRDILHGSTSRGPHRDDVRIMINGVDARTYASEGQQRGGVLALRFAQLQWLAECTKESPVVLADDVLGELDPVRRRAFWQLLGDRHQIIASGTHLAELDHPQRSWVVHTVSNGSYEEAR